MHSCHDLMDCPSEGQDVLGHGQRPYGNIQGLNTTYDGLGTHGRIITSLRAKEFKKALQTFAQEWILEEKKT